MKRLHWATVLLAFGPRIWELIRSLFPFILFSLFRSGGDSTELVIAGISILGGLGAISTWLTTRVGVENGQLVATSGWIWRRDRRIPLDRIQNVNLRRNIAERLLKVVTLEVETAGGTKPELKLSALSENDAYFLRGQLVAQELREVAGPLRPALDVKRMSKHDLLLGAVTENSGGRVLLRLLPFVSIGILGASLPSVLNYGRLLPAGLWIALGLSVLLLIMGLGWVWGVVGYVTKFGGFTLTREPGLIRVRHGLLTQVQYALRPSRAEFIKTEQSLWARLARRCDVKLGTAGSFGEAGTLAPIALMLPQEEAGRVEQELFGSTEEASWHRLPGFYIGVRTARSLLFVSLLCGITYFVSGVWSGAPEGVGLASRLLTGICSVLTLLMAFHIIDAWLSFRRTAYQIGPDFLRFRTGFFLRTEESLPWRRAEVVTTIQSPFWRRRGLVELSIRATLHHISIPMMPLRDAERVEAALRAHALRRFDPGTRLTADASPEAV